ncbi:hypothetical protein VCRA2116O373_40032 [Vibrio crassostreae]|nr:hypothetical protein VCRA2116O373_40032 [Vibrio crassostreae]
MFNRILSLWKDQKFKDAMIKIIIVMIRTIEPMTCNLNLFTLFFHYFLLDLFLIIIISSKVRYPLKINQIKILNGFSFSIIRF